MSVDAINHYLKHYTPGTSEINVLHRLRDRQQAHKDFQDSFDSRMNQAFIRIERVTSARPVLLFGQHVPSYAFNRIAINRGTNDESGKRVPGDSLLTALVSEESLARLMLSTNTTGNKVALTLESALGETLPTVKRHTRKTSLELLKEKIYEIHETKVRLIQTLWDNISSRNKELTKKASAEYLSTLNVIRRFDTDFLLEHHMEDLSDNLVQYRTEAANAALNIYDLLKDVERLKLLEGNEPDPADITDVKLARNSNPLLDYAMNLYHPNEVYIYRKAVLACLEDQLEKAFSGSLDYNPDKSDRDVRA